MTEASTDATAGGPESGTPPDGPRSPRSQAKATEDPPVVRRTWPWFVSIVVALALLMGLVWAAGGFDQRTDVKTAVKAATTVVTGPYVLTFTDATIQKTKNTKDEQIWTVVVNGTGRTTGEESISPDYDDMFVVRDPASRTTGEPNRQEFGAENRGISGGAFFTPGLAAIPYRVKAELPAEAFEPGRSIGFAVWDLEWRDVSLLGNGDFRWAPTNDFSLYDLPLRRLPDDVD